MNFKNVNPFNADQELLDDYFELSKQKLFTKDGKDIREDDLHKANKILIKHGYLSKNDDLNKTVVAIQEFKDDIDNDGDLMWRRMQLMDESLFK